MKTSIVNAYRHLLITSHIWMMGRIRPSFSCLIRTSAPARTSNRRVLSAGAPANAARIKGVHPHGPGQVLFTSALATSKRLLMTGPCLRRAAISAAAVNGVHLQQPTSFRWIAGPVASTFTPRAKWRMTRSKRPSKISSKKSSSDGLWSKTWSKRRKLGGNCTSLQSLSSSRAKAFFCNAATHTAAAAAKWASWTAARITASAAESSPKQMGCKRWSHWPLPANNSGQAVDKASINASGVNNSGIVDAFSIFFICCKL